MIPPAPSRPETLRALGSDMRQLLAYVEQMADLLGSTSQIAEEARIRMPAWRALAHSALAGPQAPSGAPLDGICGTCYHPLDKCSHCDQEASGGRIHVQPQMVWLCGCGIWNGVNLASCRGCLRPSNETDVTQQLLPASPSASTEQP